jgi:replication factor C subunit 3/5
MQQQQENIPWTEKYRPTKFDDIVLDPSNKIIFMNMLENKYFPNLLFYGPPGTGKTTTIINLVNEYQRIKKTKSPVIHLNASDDRGIDIIRNHIYQFVRTKNLFETGLKFVILDEVDYMTKNAQQALKYLLQTCGNNVKFFLICNYISKIDYSLQHEFLCIRFNQLPPLKIRDFIKDICVKEGVEITDKQINMIQDIHKSDIRSMINFVQLNQNTMAQHNNIVDDSVWKSLHQAFKGNHMFFQRDSRLDNKGTFGAQLKELIHSISVQYNMDKRQIIRDYYNYIIQNYPVSTEMLDTMETVMHNPTCKIETLVNFFIYSQKRIS